MQLNRAIESARLLLEPLHPNHADRLFVPLQNEAIYQWISSRPPDDLSKLRARYTRLSPSTSSNIPQCISNDGTELWLNWVVVRKDDQQPIGLIDISIDHPGDT